MQLQQLTIAQKLAAGFALLFLPIVLMSGHGIADTRRVAAELVQVAQLEEMVAASYEMEINVVGLGLGVMKYLATGEPQARERVNKDGADFAKYSEQFGRMAKLPRDVSVSADIGERFKDFQSLGLELMRQRDLQDALSLSVSSRMDQIDALLDDQLQAHLTRNGSVNRDKLLLSVELESDIAETGAWLGNYQRTPTEESKERVLDNAKDALEHLAQLGQFPLDAMERRWVTELEQMLSESLQGFQNIVTAGESIAANTKRFIALRTKLDHLLDEGVQTLSKHSMDAARSSLEGGVHRDFRLLLGTGAFSILGCGFIAWRLGRGVTRSLNRVKDGVNKIGAGQLDYRLPVSGRDEFAVLSNAFNNMLDVRQQAQEQLHSLNAALDRRVAERTAELIQTNELLAREIENGMRVMNELRLSEDYAQSIIRSSFDMIVSVDTERRITEFNDAAEYTFGYPREEVLGQSVELLYAEPEEGRRINRTTLERGRCVEEVQNRGKNGRRFTSFLTATRLRNRAGQVLGVMGISRDITERKLLEEQLRQSQKMETLGHLASGIAHDFNNILSVILGNAQLIAVQKGLSPDLVESARETVNAANLGAIIARQLLVFSRKESFQPSDLNLNTVVADSQKMFAHLVAGNIRLEQQFADNLPAVRADRSMVQVILLNLVVNARDAMPDGGQLTLRTEAITVDGSSAATHPQAVAGEFVRLSVIDTGGGISDENLPRIFEVFFSTKASGSGTGLGLATVFRIVQQHDGWINVRSKLGQGTAFEIYLPTTQAGLAERPAEAPPRGGTETILVVDDNESVLHTMRQIVEGLGYRVFEANSGPSALLVWEQHRHEIQLLLTDMMMPGMSGGELARVLLENKPELKVLYVSGSMSDAIFESMPLGTRHNFLPKPTGRESLANMIRHILDVSPLASK